MDAPNNQRSSSDSLESPAEEIWLLGQSPLSSYLEFVTDDVIDGATLQRSQLVEEWRAANDYYAVLEDTEAGLADHVETSELDSEFSSSAERVAADPRYKRAFDSLPTRFAMVDLRHVIASQLFISKHHTDRMKPVITALQTPQALFDYCQPLSRGDAPVEIQKSGSRSFRFWSPSSDFRYHETQLLQTHQLQDYDPIGPLAGAVSAMVGYGSNFLNLIQSDGRLLLHNGYHRAYALLEAGITRAPCIVQTVTRVDELKISAARAVREDPSYYFASPRPPLMKDFFDPKIRKVHRVHDLINLIEVNVEIKEFKRIRRHL